jgi:hypothetical protein
MAKIGKNFIIQSLIMRDLESFLPITCKKKLIYWKTYRNSNYTKAYYQIGKVKDLYSKISYCISIVRPHHLIIANYNNIPPLNKNFRHINMNSSNIPKKKN